MVTEILLSEDVRQDWRNTLDRVVAGNDVVIKRYSKPLAALISYEDYVALRDELDALRADRRAQAAYEDWKADPSTARPYREFRDELIADELIADGLIDAYL